MVRALRCLRPDANGETPFVRLLNRVFCKVGGSIARHPWEYTIVSTLVTLLCSSIIPFTPMSNNVSDFTPTGARARKELATFEAFFSNKGEPIALYVLVTAKNQGNMLGLKQLEETVKLLNTVSENFKVYNSATGRNESFIDFCDNFCTINEPIRHFYSGLMIEKNFGNTSDHIDLGYPITTVLGRQLFMDPNFFGVKIAISASPSNHDKIETVSVNQLQSVNGRSMLDAQKTTQVRNNIREIKLVGLQFRAERPNSISKESLKKWERTISDYVQKEFKSDYVDAYVLSETILTDEVVRAGLTLLPFLVIGFSIMILFSCVTMGLAALYMSQMRFHKFLLAFVASCCPFMACGTTFGLLFWLGIRFGSILCVTPFLVLALGVDDAYLMLNSWQRLRRKKEKAFHVNFTARVTNGSTTSSSTSSSSCCSSVAVDERVEKLMEEVMIDTGASITITTLTNALAFGIGALTPTPEIQIFSIGNCVAIIVVYIFVWTIFGSVMAIVGRWEMAEICRYEEECIEKGALQYGGNTTHYSSLHARQIDSSCSAASARLTGLTAYMQGIRRWFLSIASKYCRLLTNGFVAALVMALLAAYIYISMYGLLNIKAELRPEQLFLKTSDVMKILELRNEFIIPFYAICFIVVNKPGNLSDPTQVKKLHKLVSEYESLPSSVGRFSTKFWLRDYEQFVLDNDGKVVDDLAAFETQVDGKSLDDRNKNEIHAFLEWPEFEHWKGFVRLENSSSSRGGGVNDNRREVIITKFFFSTASYGPELKEWSKRGELLNEWRRVADMFPELEVSVYEDDAKFLDLIPTMISQTVQSSLATLFCMFLVCILFMTHPTTVLVSNLAILSTCIGVFGLMSLWGADLDPILMSAAIMSIGFSVDIPAHISYHFYKTGLVRSPSGKKKSVEVEKRLRHCISAIGFPVLEAGLSTIICVSSLLFVELHMAQIFARTLILVVAIGLIHGMLVIPVIFYLISLLPSHLGGSNRLRPDGMKSPAPAPPLPLTTTSSRNGVLTISLSVDHANGKL